MNDKQALRKSDGLSQSYPQTAKPIVKSIGHVALHVSDPDKLAKFYTTVLGLQIVAEGKVNSENVRSSLFLGNQLESEQYQLALFANEDMQHAAFEVNSLADLKRFYELIVEYGLPIRWVLNHGVSLAFYFHDPAGNLIKLYWSTGEDCPQPYGYPIDLTQSEVVVRQNVAEMLARLKAAQGE